MNSRKLNADEYYIFYIKDGIGLVNNINRSPNTFIINDSLFVIEWKTKDVMYCYVDGIISSNRILPDEFILSKDIDSLRKYIKYLIGIDKMEDCDE